LANTVHSQKQIFLNPFQLIDVNRESDEELQQHLWCGLVAFVLKYRKARKNAEFLERLLPWLHKIEIQQGLNYAKIVLKYAFSEMESDKEQLFIQKVEQYLSAELRGEVMTLAQQLEQRGIKSILLQQLQCKFGSLPAHYQQQLDQATSDQLMKWANAILQAQVLCEVFER